MMAAKKKLKMKKNYLLARIPEILSGEPRGNVLDLGCGRGEYAVALHELGFEVTAADFLEEHFEHRGKIKFQKCNLTQVLPFADSSFDYLIFIEVIEHLERPFDVIGEICRVLKPGGKLILSTPNILHLGSRMRFLFEGCFDFFREPVLDLQEHYIGTIDNLHIIPWRYHELEYMLFRKGFGVEGVYTDYVYKDLYPLYILLFPWLVLQRRAKERKSLEKGGMDFRRINNILFLKELMFGKHLIVKAVNNKRFAQTSGHFEKASVPKFDPAGSR